MRFGGEEKERLWGKNILMGKENVCSGEGGESFEGEEECFEMGRRECVGGEERAVFVGRECVLM